MGASRAGGLLERPHVTRDQDALALAERVLAILEEGNFSATYKYAVFTAILDLCIEKASKHGVPPETLTTRQLAERVLALYWSHVTPYEGVGDSSPGWRPRSAGHDCPTHSGRQGAMG